MPVDPAQLVQDLQGSLPQLSAGQDEQPTARPAQRVELQVHRDSSSNSFQLFVERGSSEPKEAWSFATK